MPGYVVSSKGIHEEVGMIVPLLHTHLPRLPTLGHHCRKRLRLQQLKKLISRALIDQNVAFPTVLFEEKSGIMLGPSTLIVAEISAQLFAAPLGLRWMGDRRKGRK